MANGGGWSWRVCLHMRLGLLPKEPPLTSFFSGGVALHSFPPPLLRFRPTLLTCSRREAVTARRCRCKPLVPSCWLVSIFVLLQVIGSVASHLEKLSLIGKITKLSNPHEFPPNLLKLTLHTSHLQKESTTKLERLPKLKMLILGKGAYNVQELSFNVEGFSQLNILRLIQLKELEQWTIKKRALPRLEHMVIDGCEKC
ncbi:hypothetical protein PIB30_027889 [Stylosanthes scabra]|uniref:Uncharacterized protein n=1 Tax=Stylosanthes scabra TaxID=79078 RepID=A0ABU6XB13_9FABA|nr:hypothetical protein [Stylosanthes scabra]